MSDCTRLGNWLLTLADRRAALLPSDRISEHLRSCRACRQRIDTLLRELSGRAAAAISCDDALDQMPMLVDLERSDGATAAARLIPDVWRHRLCCADCAEHYLELAQLAQLPADVPEPGRRGAREI
jgi:hypothetical protein